MIENRIMLFKTTLDNCVGVYDTIMGGHHVPDESSSVYLYNILSALEPQVSEADLKQLLEDHPGLTSQIRKRVETRFWYQQPIVLFALFVADHHSDLDALLIDLDRSPSEV